MAVVGTILPETLVWAEGQPGWLALRDCAELQAAGAAANGAAASAAPSNGAVSTGADPHPDPGLARPRGVTAKAVRAAPAARLDPELAAFRAEISAIDGDASAPVAEASTASEAEAPASPPPDEREFEDDDGTWYAWDPALRKFVAREPAGGAAGGPRGPNAAAAPAYDVVDMTFEADEEVVPTYAPPDPDSDAEGEEPPAKGGGGGPAGKPSAARQRGSEQPETSGPGQAPAAGGEGVLTAAGGGPAAAAEAEATPPPAEGAGAQGKAGRQTGAEAVMERVREKQKRAREVGASLWKHGSFSTPSPSLYVHPGLWYRVKRSTASLATKTWQGRAAR